jgi:hypothetical protein
MQKPSTKSKKQTPKPMKNAGPAKDAPKKKAASPKPSSNSRTSSPAPKTLGADQERKRLIAGLKLSIDVQIATLQDTIKQLKVERGRLK